MDLKERIKLEHNLYIIGLCLPCMGAVIYVAGRILPAEILGKFYIPCILHQVTGLYCPGCGGTRAVETLLEGKFFISFLYHPVVLYAAAVYIWFMISHTIEKLSGRRYKVGMHYRHLYIYLAFAVIIINTAVKDIALTAFGIDILKILDYTQALI